MDFVSDALADGRPFRCLTIVDDFTRECPAIAVAHSLPAWRVIHTLDRLAVERGLPRSTVLDNGPEFAGKALDLWTHQHGVALQFIRPGKADREWLRGELQRQVPRRVSERELVHELERRASRD